MKLLNKLTLKNLRLNKVRTIVTIVGIMLSAALITVVSGMALSGRQTMIDGQTEWSGNYDVALDIIDTAKLIKSDRTVMLKMLFIRKDWDFPRQQLPIMPNTDMPLPQSAKMHLTVALS